MLDPSMMYSSARWTSPELSLEEAQRAKNDALCRRLSRDHDRSVIAKVLDERRPRILEAELDTVSRIYWLLEDCKRYGTLPFAGLARAGFIAVQILQSLVATGILTPEDYQRFMNSLDTVGSRLSRDLARLDRGLRAARAGRGRLDAQARRDDHDGDAQRVHGRP